MILYYFYLWNMKVDIRIALPADYELITKVGHDTFYETWKDVNTPADMAVYLKKAFDPKVILSDLEIWGKYFSDCKYRQ